MLYQTYSLTCEFEGKFGRAACIASCMAQNCGTGYCKGPEDDQTCVCSRCKDGPSVTATVAVEL